MSRKKATTLMQEHAEYPPLLRIAASLYSRGIGEAEIAKMYADGEFRLINTATYSGVRNYIRDLEKDTLVRQGGKMPNLTKLYALAKRL